MRNTATIIIDGKPVTVTFEKVSKEAKESQLVNSSIRTDKLKREGYSPLHKARKTTYHGFKSCDHSNPIVTRG